MRIKLITAALLPAAIFVVASNPTVSAQAAATDTKPVVTVVVQPGDSLSKIAAASATTYIRLYDANANIAHPDVIHPGETLRVPAADEQLTSRPLPSPPVVAQASAQPATQKRAATAQTQRAAVNDGSAWGQLAACESGGNPATNTGNGYYGAYQFSASTWKAVGGSGLPHQASLEEQTARAQTLQARSGWGQWPSCSAKLGLR